MTEGWCLDEYDDKLALLMPAGWRLQIDCSNCPEGRYDLELWDPLSVQTRDRFTILGTFQNAVDAMKAEDFFADRFSLCFAASNDPEVIRVD